ncbi:MAG: tyrosinase family protein, partial [Candidatus Nitrotoga sp.]
TRSNAWNKGGTFANDDLLWYAKGVGVMQSRALNDPNSWWFFAAIHGEYVSAPETGYPGWGFIPPVPSVPTSPLPSQSDLDTYWNQCQHQSWFFPPWHRGYLIALEEQVREAIISLGGPATWALPYWDYLGSGDEYMIPPAFVQQNLPDGSANPLYVTARYGPKSDGNIFIPIPPVSGACMSNDLYTGSNVNTPRPGFGGPQTGFWHGGGISGNLENNPHNQVHVDVGGVSPDGSIDGLMSDPGLAALDPIFYLHHCNIDRMWAVWNADGNANPTSSSWLAGPATMGERKFIMPKPGAVPWVYTPADVGSLDTLDYIYEAATVQVTGIRRTLSKRLTQLGVVTPVGVSMTMAENIQNTSELVGAHDGALRIGSSGVRASVKLDNQVRNKMVSTLATASVANVPDRVYLQLENVRGTRDANKLNIYVNGIAAGCVALFGMHRASLKDGEHGGSGLTLEVEISDIIDTLHMENALDVNSLDVRIIPDHSIQKDSEISVGRISVYREGSM